jgi:membrane protease YdiL (CAAX protease family)
MNDVTVRGAAEDARAVVAATAAPLTVWARGWLIIELWPRVVVGQRGTFHIRFINPAATPAPVDVEVRDAENTLHLETASLAPVIVPARGVAGPIRVEVLPTVQGPVGEGQTYPLEFRFRSPRRAETITPDLVARAAFTYVPPVHALRRALAAMNRVLPVYAAAIMAAEAVTARGGVVLGTLCHAVLVLALLNHYVWLGPAARRHALLVLVLVPLLRILSVTMPSKQLPPLYWFVLIGLPLLLSAAWTVRLLGLPWSGLGLRRRSWPWQCLVACSGLPLGAVGVMVGHPKALIPALDWRDLVVGALILTIFVGFTEELLFRGLLQQVMIDVFGPPGLLWSTVIYTALYVSSLPVSGVLFIGLVSLFFGWCVQRTGSLWGVVAAHSGLAVGMACVWPFLLH